ncbi:MAG TPA: DASS family sodium-coupled anion symporter [Gemmatimonadales bacterium]|nr:DASS family sodium-coupled anion symporter [Gemmatimonadales bacterium]
MRAVGLVAGPLLFVLVLLLPVPREMGVPAQRTAALVAWMATWWLTVPVPLQATALLPLLVLPLLGVAGFDRAAVPYANNVIFLFLGGFFIAAAMEHWGLHRRVAYAILAAVGTDARMVVLAFILSTAFMSMWISNTATAVMMMSMATAVLALARTGEQGVEAPGKGSIGGLGPALVLGVAYAASIGGMATLIGTPPNAIFAGAARELLGVEFGFGRWLRVGLPIVLVLVPACWLLLVTLFPTRGEIPALAERVRSERTGLGPLRGGERWTLVVFLMAVTAWVMRDPKDIGAVRIPGIATWLPAVTDSWIAIAAALLLFVVPVSWREMRFALDWKTARAAPWGMLLLFGGGLSLADAVQSSGLSGWIGSLLTGMAGQPKLLVIAVVAAMFTALTELASNAAVSALAMPLLAAIAPALGQDPLVLMQVAALASSLAFVLPVSTPPNTVAFATGEVTVLQMAKAGIVMVAVSIATITVVMTMIG